MTGKADVNNLELLKQDLRKKHPASNRQSLAPNILFVGNDRGSVPEGSAATQGARSSILSPKAIFQNRLNSNQETAPPFSKQYLTGENIGEISLAKILEKRSALHSHRVSDIYAHDVHTIGGDARSSSPYSSLASPLVGLQKESYKK